MSIALSAQALVCQIHLVNILFTIEAMCGKELSTCGKELSTEPWEQYIASDYDSPEMYCQACLVDLNSYEYRADVRRCYLPITAPRKSTIMYLEALRIAEKFLINPENTYFFGDRQIRIQAARTLVSYLQSCEQTIDPALVELSESE